jgi:hypothetical protein
MVLLHANPAPAKEVRRREPRELDPVVTEMRLIEVPALQRHLRPRRSVLASHALERALKSDDPRIPLRRHTHLFAEQFDESTVAQLKFACDITDFCIRFGEFSDRYMDLVSDCEGANEAVD